MGSRVERTENIRGKEVAPSNAQKNSDITKAEIEAKLIGEISSHSHNIVIPPIVTKEYIESLLMGIIISHNHPSASFTYFP